MTANVLAELGAMIASGAIEVVDCSGVLGPETPLLKLPPDFAKDTPPIKIHRISEYDKDGPFWAWNWLELGEHSGTHFDAPHHWITGKDYADGTTDRIPPQNFVAPVNVIDRSKEATANPDYLLTVESIKEWEGQHGAIEAGSWVLLRTDWSKKVGHADYVGMRSDGAHSPGPDASAIRFLVEERDQWLVATLKPGDAPLEHLAEALQYRPCEIG